MDLKEKIRVIENFPKEGISFKDITTLISDGEALKETIDQFVMHLKDKKIDLIVGPEARGFIFGVPVAVCFRDWIYSSKKTRKITRRNYFS